MGLVKLQKQGDDLQRQSNASVTLASKVAAVVRQIQTERERNTDASCLDRNRTNTRIKVEVAKLITRPQTPAQRAETQRVIFGIAHAIAPRKNCDRVVDKQVKGARP